MKKTELTPALRLVNNEEVRKRLLAASESKIMDVNGPILANLLQVRAQLAELRGYTSSAEFEEELLMAQNPAEVEKFLSHLTQELLPIGRKQMDQLTKMKQDHTGNQSAVMNAWDLSYYLTLVEKADGVDDQKIKEYLPADHIVEKTLGIYQELLGLNFTKEECSTWHKDVTCFKTHDAKSGELLGQFYLDLYPRDGKYGHAMCTSIIKRSTLKPDKKKAVAAVVANFNKPTET